MAQQLGLFVPAVCSQIPLDLLEPTPDIDMKDGGGPGHL